MKKVTETFKEFNQTQISNPNIKQLEANQNIQKTKNILTGKKTDKQAERGNIVETEIESDLSQPTFP